MHKSNYSNPLQKQCLSLPELCDDQIRGSVDGVMNAIPVEVMQKIRKIILTGCGDSYMAAHAVIPAFKKYARIFGTEFEAMRCIDVSRCLYLDEQNASATLVVAISASGAPARISEALLRARHFGAHTMAVTNNPESGAGKSAEYVLFVGTPDFPDPNPGLRNYYASLVSLMLFAARLGEVKGISPLGSVNALSEQIREYTRSFSAALPDMDESMFRLAQHWQCFDGFDMLGDDTDHSTASFIAAKFVEVSGVMCAVCDMENWCHVEFFKSNPTETGTVIVCRSRGADLSRVKETIHQAQCIGRPILLITDSDEDFALSTSSSLCKIPSPPTGFEFLAPILNYVPGALLASYYSALNEIAYFRGGGVWAEANTIRTSRIVNA